MVPSKKKGDNANKTNRTAKNIPSIFSILFMPIVLNFKKPSNYFLKTLQFDLQKTIKNRKINLKPQMPAIGVPFPE
jgi:hypothetical protein